MAFKNKGIAFLVGTLVGSVIGSATALLFAPKSGKELRGDIKAGTEKVLEAGSEAIDGVSETVFEVSKKIEDGAVKAVCSAKQGVQKVVDGFKWGKAQAGDEQTAEQEEDFAEAQQSELVLAQGEELAQEQLAEQTEQEQVLHN